MPADKATPGPINVSSPIEMYCSLKIVVGFHMMRLRFPNEANFLPRESCALVDAQNDNRLSNSTKTRPTNCPNMVNTLVNRPEYTGTVLE